MKGQGREKRKKGWVRSSRRRGNGQLDVGAGVRRGGGVAVEVGGQPNCTELGLSVTGHTEFLI